MAIRDSTHLNGGDVPPAAAAAATEDVEVVSNRYFSSGEWELHSADGVKFRIGRHHLHGSTLYAVAQHTRVIQLQDTFADEQAIHLLLDFQSANLATETAAGIPRPTILSPDSGNSGSSGLDSGLGSESTLGSRSASVASAQLTSPLAATTISGQGPGISPGNGSGGSGSDSRHGSSLSSLPSASASVSPSPSPSRDLSLASAGLERLLPVLKLAHRYEFPVQGEILLAITDALGSSRTTAPDTLATFVTASELGSPDLAHAAVRAMVRGDARRYSPLAWDAVTFAAVPKEYHWALQRCFVPAAAGGDGGVSGDYVMDEDRFVPALFEYRALTAHQSGQGGAQN